MKVAELFIELGVKGQDKTVSALVGVEKGLGGLASMSLEAKAAIVGAMYALEQLFSKSGAQGTALTNLNAGIGVNIQTMQQYQYAARQMGVSNEETASSFKALQATMTKTAMGQGAPKGFGQVAMLTGGITAADVNRFMQNPELLLQKLQDYAQREKRIGVANEALRSFGLSDNMIAAVRRKAFTPEVMQRAPTYSDGEVKALDRANIAWANLGNTIQMAIGHFNAAHGGQIVKDFGILVNIGMKLAEVVMKIVEHFKLFEKLDKGFKILENGTAKVFHEIYKLGELIENFASKNHIFEGITGEIDHLRDSLEPVGRYFIGLGQAMAKVGENSKFLKHIGTIFSESIDVVSRFARVFGQVETAIVNVAEKFHVFEAIGKVVDGFLTMIEMTLRGVSKMLEILEKNHIGGAVEEAGTSAGNAAMDFLRKKASEPGIFRGMLQMVGVVPTGSERAVPVSNLPPGTPAPSPAVNLKPETGTPAPSPAVNLKPEAPSDASKPALGPNPRAEAPVINLRPANPAAIMERLVNPPTPPTAPTMQFVPQAPAAPTSTLAQNTQNVEVNQTLNFQGAQAAPHDTAHALKRAVNNAFRQLSSQTQGA